MPRSALRSSAPSSPAKSREPTTSPQQTRRTTRTRTREVSTAASAKRRHVKNPLDAVAEEGDTIVLRDPHSTQGIASSHNIIAQNEGNDHSRSTRRAPSIRASVYDELAPTELHVESMVKHLTELNFRADELLSYFTEYTNDELTDRLGRHHDSAWIDFSDDAARLERERQYYVVNEDFLQIEALRQELVSRNLQTTGAELIFMKANLALLLYRLLESHRVELHNLLMTLASIQTFPEPFITRSTPVEYDDTFKRLTIAVGLQILTQCFIFNARRNISNIRFDLTGSLEHIFETDGGEIRDVSLGIGSQAEWHTYRKSTEKAVSTLEQVAFSNPMESTDFKALEDNYSWSEFMVQILSWLRTRAEQIDDEIAREGGVWAIKRSFQRSNAIVAPKASRGKSRPSRADEKFAGKINFLRDVDDHLNAGGRTPQAPEDEEEDEAGVDSQGQPTDDIAGAPQPTRILQEIVPESSHICEQPQDVIQEQEEEQDQSNLVDDSEPHEQEIPDSAQSPSPTPAIRPTQETSAVLRVLQRQTKEGNKENSPPAQRSQISNRQGTVPTSASVATAPATSVQAGKRRQRDHEEVDSDEDDDEFESDRRHVKRPRPHKGKAPAPEPAPTSVSNHEPLDPDLLPAETIEQGETTRQSSLPPPRRPTQTNRPGPASTQPAPARSTSTNPFRAPSTTQPPPSSYETYIQAKQQVRSNTSFAASVAPPTNIITATLRPPQTRRAWSAPEIERLLYLMRQYGCAWSTIKKADERMVDPQLLERNQVQLKDKARNMKMDFLKAEVTLPDELGAVTISKSHKEMLRSMNIAYPGEEYEE